jgi:hypothetical protein
MDRKQLTELIKTIRNRCNIYLMIHDRDEAEGVLPTVLEDICSDAQVIFETCVEKDE